MGKGSRESGRLYFVMPAIAKDPLTERLGDSFNRFTRWLDETGTSGHDPYDIWSTPYGLWARGLFYRYGKVAAPGIAPLLLADKFIPGLVAFTTSKKAYATSHAHLILAYLNLYETRGAEAWISRSKVLADELDRMKTTGYAGDGWGYPFDWQNRRGLWLRGTPYITVTPYVFDALLRLYQVTQDDHYKSRLLSVVGFAHKGLNNSQRPSGSVASSYSPLDNSRIVNASAYRAYVLTKASDEFGLVDESKLADKLIRFVLESQDHDGSWPYAVESKGDDFVDHFHTCFVLKNLAKILKVTGDGKVRSALERGYAYYAEHLFDQAGLPKPFSKGGNSLLKYSLYDFAEAVNLGVLLRSVIPGAYDRALHVAKEILDKFQLKDGHFATSVSFAGMINKTAYIRWPQAQLFYSLTALQKETAR